MEKINLSIILISYNHEKYIKDAIESILKQKVDFTYEIVFADDASKDKTKDIIKSYDKVIKYKQYLFSKENHGNTYNTWNALSKCRGDYVIILEGDDYWIWEDKIKTQYHFLVDNPKYIGVSDKRCEVNRKGHIITHSPEWVKKDCDTTLEDFLNLKLFSCVETMYKNIYKKEKKNKKLKELFTSDRMICDIIQCIYTLNYIQGGGLIRLLNVDGAVYRTITSGNKTNYNATQKVSKIAMDHIDILNRIDKYYDYKLNLNKFYGKFIFPVWAYGILSFNLKDYKMVKEKVNQKYLKYFRLHFIYFLGMYLKVVFTKIKKELQR